MTINSGSGLPLSSTKFELDDAIFQPIIVPFNPTSVPSPISLTEKSDFGISVLTNRIAERKVSGGKDGDSKIVSYELRTKDGERYNGDPSTINEGTLYGINIPVEKQDTSESILLKGYEAAAFYVGGADAKRIAAQVIVEQDAEDAKKALAGKDIVANGVRNVDIQSGKIKEAKGSSEIQALQRQGKMDFYVPGSTLKRMDQIHAQKLVMDALQRYEMPNDALLTRAAADKEALNAALKEVGWHPIPTHEEAVANRAAEIKAEMLERRREANSKPYIDTIYNRWPESRMTEAQLGEYARKQAENEVRRAIGKGELTVRNSNEPASIRPTNNSPFGADAVKLLAEKFFPEWNTTEGPTTRNVEAMVYGWINARTFGYTDLYVDKRRFQNERQANEAKASQMLGSIVGEFQNLKASGKTVEAIMATPKVTKAVVALNNSGVFGRTLVKSLPSAVTFGGVQTVKETVKISKDESEGVAKAVANITRAATEGAVFGVLQPLPLKTQIPAVAASSYGIEKVFGADNQQAAQTAFLNGIFALAGGRTNAAKELNGKTIRVTGENGTAANVRLSVAPNGRIRLTELPQTFRANLQVKVSELKAAVQTKVENAGQYLKDKVAVTDVQIADARKVIREYTIRQEKAPQLFIGGIDVKYSKAVAILAADKIQKGATKFGDFASQMLKEAGVKVKKDLRGLYETKMAIANKPLDTEGISKFEAEQLLQQSNIEKIYSYRKNNKLPKYSPADGSTGTSAYVKIGNKDFYGLNTSWSETLALNLRSFVNKFFRESKMNLEN